VADWRVLSGRIEPEVRSLRSKTTSIPIERAMTRRLQTVTAERSGPARALEPVSEMPTMPRSKVNPEVDSRFENALRRHLSLVWRLLRRNGLSDSDADDAAQDVFWVFAQRTDRVPEAAERAFLVATALHIASERRRSKWYRSPTEPLQMDQLPIAIAGPDQALELKRRVDMLDAALRCLDDKEREVFVLAELEELSKAEVALVLRIPEGTVASRLARARESFHAVVARLHAERGNLL